MMREHELRLASRRAASRAGHAASELRLGDVDSLRAKLPLRVEFAGEPVWLVELAGELRVHSAVCPHMLGPLPPACGDGAEPVECPWHGYRFDVRTRTSCAGDEWELKRPPRLAVEAGEVVLRTHPAP